MSLRLASSAKNLRDQFKGNSNNSNNSNTTSSNTSNSHNAMSSGSSIFTATSGISHAKTMDITRMNSANSILSRPGTVLRATSNGNLRRTKSTHKKKLIAKVFADDSDALPDLSMEMTLLIVKRCIKEIRERGLTTKGILRQVQMGQNQKVIMDTIRLILDDDASTELSVLRQVDIHLVAHAMKWAIRYSEETLVTYGDYQALYLNQDRSFSRFVHDLPSTNRSILLDLFSLCADVTLLAHLNGMTLVAVAKAISLSIMAEPEREFTTFDASLQQRNLWGAACEDLLRAFLRIKTTHDLAKIEQEDEVDENRYVDNITREVRSARQRNNDNGNMPHIPMNSRHDVSVPSSVGSVATVTPSGSIRGRSGNNPLDQASTSRSASPLSQHSSTLNESLSRNHSLAKSNSSRSGPISPAWNHDQELMEYEEIMKNQSHLSRLRQSRQFRQSRQYRQSMSLKPGDKDRRRSSIADMESLHMLPVDESADGYESEPEPFHDTILPDFADGLGWDFSKLDALQVEEGPSLNVTQSASVSRSNSSSIHGSTLPSFDASLKQQPHATTVQFESLYLEDDMEPWSPPQVMVQRSATSSTTTRAGHIAGAGYMSPAVSPQHAKRDSLLHRSLSLDPQTMNGRNHKRPTELRHDILTRELSLQAEKPEVADDIRQRVMQVKQNGLEDAPASSRTTFSLESSPQDLDRPAIPTRNASHGLGRSMSSTSRSSHMSKSSRMSKSSNSDTKLEINVGGLPPKSSHPGAMDELTPVSNPSSSSSIASPESQHSIRKSQEHGANTAKKFEVVSRPKDMEISVHFTPISPVSPKTELRSKFHESFSDLPVAPPPGYVQRQSSTSHPHKKSPTTTNIKSGQSSKMSTSSSTISSSLQQPSSKSMSRSNSKGQPHPAPLSSQQSVNSSNASITSSVTSASESKSKAAGFIRALSFKLRSKHSDEHLKPIKINNQVVGSAPVPPAVPIQPPRLELSFLGGAPSGASTSATASKLATGGNMPPATAPATLLQPGKSLTGSPESWRRAAQAALPVPSASADRLGSDRLKGFTGARRSSGALFGSGNVALREQRRKSRISVISPRSPGNLHHHPGANSPAARSKADGKRAVGSSDPSSGRSPQRRERTLSDSSYTTDDSGSLDGPAPKSEQPPTATNPKKAGEREYRFSTATLLKDGKLYYQLQWDQFSESGFKSDFFHQPEQYLTGLQQKRISKFPANGPVMNSSAAMGKTKMSLPPTNSATSQDRAPLGQVGQNQDQDYSPDPGPSPAQRAAAMKAARESFMALAKDPKALAALKAGSTGGIGQATIIGTGSFPIGSTQPVLQPQPLNLNWDAVPSKTPTSPKSALRTLNQSSSSDKNNHSNMRSLQSVKEDDDKHLKNTSAKSSATLSATGAASQDPKMLMSKPGKQSTTVGGAGSFSSSHTPSPAADKNPSAPVCNPAFPPPKSPKKSRLFGARLKSSKKNNRLSTSMASSSSAMNASWGKKRGLPMGVGKRDTLTKTEESLDEVFPWTCIEHMAGQESGWVMLEPVQDGAVGWIKIDKLEEEMARFAQAEQRQQQQQQQQQ